MASPLFSPQTCRLPGLSNGVIPVVAAAPRDSKPSSAARRQWWAPFALPAVRRAGSDGTAGGEAAAPSAQGGRETAAGPGSGEISGARRRSFLTPEKAKVLRKELRATETWHDAMYHSAIASRLASPDER
ncbi:unnamed protein product [Spirodela intermedia]|uniref:Uncharacterized protein n=1 Tax=Spirodela intermedia TaxID=51605 RepID=A0A7I8K368_SPIIN|nr:unnamed protein product [Spirodela intermedia]